MKICFLAHASSIHTVRWVTYFNDKGHDCHVITLTPPGEFPSGVHVKYIKHKYPISYERSNWRYLMHLPAIWRSVRDIGPDLVNAHFLSSYGLLGALTCPRDIPYVISLYGSDILMIPERSPLHSLVARLSLSRAKLVISVSENMTRTLQRYIPARISVLTTQYGIDTTAFHPPDSDMIRDPICLSTRALVKVSDLETLLLAAKKLYAESVICQFIVAGEGELRNHLTDLINTYKLQGKVSLIGQINVREMPAIFQKSEIYISTSLSDGASLALLEAMACGAFPVVADIAANREWIEHGINGYLFKPGSVDELATSIHAAWDNPGLRRHAAAKNWQIIQKKGNYRKNMQMVEQAWDSLIQKPR